MAIPGLNGKRRRVALVVERPDQLGSARQFGFLADNFCTNEIFYDCDVALNWLLGENQPRGEGRAGAVLVG